MIFSKFINGNPDTLGIMACRICGSAKPDVPTQELCDCACKDCLTTYNVFAEIGSNDPKKNDKREFLFRVLDVSDTAVLKLFKDGAEVATLDDDTYGTFFDLGTLGTGDQLFYIGYLLEWQDVLAAFGIGNYYVKAELTVLGSPVDSFSQIYTLMPYDPDVVDQTVKIASIQNGNIESSSFDYTGLNWYQEIRIKGIFWNKQPNMITDTYLTTNRTVTQIQDEIKYTYELETQFLTDDISDYLIANKILANEIYITDYNQCNTAEYCDIPVVVEEISETTEISLFRGRSHTILFTDRVQNIRKRNFK